MKTKYFAITATALILASCTNNDPVVDETKDTPIAIASAGVAELTTRAISDGKLVGTENDPATMGVFVTGGSQEKYNATNIEWEHNGTSWENKGAMMLYEGTGSKQRIYAISPYLGNGETESITVDVTAQTDLLVAKATEITGNSISLTMTHALAKLVLKPTYGTDITIQTIRTVTVGGMYASGTLDIAENTWDLGDTPTTTELKMGNNQELLVIPMAQCASFPITVVTGENRTFTATIDLSGVEKKLAAGTQYNISLQIGQDKVTLGVITAESWTSVTGGELETE